MTDDQGRVSALLGSIVGHAVWLDAPLDIVHICRWTMMTAMKIQTKKKIEVETR